MQLGELFDPANGSFQRLLGSFDILCVSIRKLLQQFVTSQIVYGLTHMLGAVLHRVDHASNDKRKLDLGGSRLRLIVIAWYQVSRIHRVCSVPGRGSKGISGCRLNQIWSVEHRLLSFLGNARE